MESNIQYKQPPYYSEETNGKVVVTIEVKGLQKKSKGTAKNATINAEFNDRSMCITIDGNKGKMEDKHFRLNIRKLPGEIIPANCVIKAVDDNFVEIQLVKAEKEVWYLKHGLETFQEENTTEK